ncbi:hydroxymethylbilane synthase [Flammeovirga aprica]|uniref:Hydroxymethylbilane synthase n=1 Tax=Flammeovirga aprica JL-4 TaxID=694437 RepID=A0A7X9P158_9BACT|nr:hydroxymethylbilane synthase [Flammeovirga aprica]NME67333.1 hydroxymethylbilane synthase [Flammeovirga aprica JL-4]
MAERIIKIGTRKSKLALWQAYYVKELLEKNNHKAELVLIETKGDKILDRSLSKIGSKGVFTEELEEQLRNGGIDIAVHSAKDMQASLGDDFELIAFTEREACHDVFVSHKEGLEINASSEIVIGTSSVRRVAMLKKHFPNAKIVDVRGNLQTRIQKMKDGLCDVLMLAYAGVHRMEYDDMIVHELPLDTFTPATGQGCVAIESAVTLDSEVKEAVRKAINDEDTERCVRGERAFLKELQGGCSIPAFCLATWTEDKQINITGGLAVPEGKPQIRYTYTVDADKVEEAGTQIAKETLANGGAELLAELKN